MKGSSTYITFGPSMLAGEEKMVPITLQKYSLTPYLFLSVPNITLNLNIKL